MHRDAEAEGAERGGSLRRHHLRRVVRRPHLQSVLRERGVRAKNRLSSRHLLHAHAHADHLLDLETQSCLRLRRCGDLHASSRLSSLVRPSSLACTRYRCSNRCPALIVASPRDYPGGRTGTRTARSSQGVRAPPRGSAGRTSSASRKFRRSKLRFYPTKLHSPRRELSNGTLIVS